MAYSELTCEDAELTLDDLYRGSLVHLDDGSWAQQVVVVGGDGGDTYDGWNDDGSTTNSLTDDGVGTDLFIDT